MIAATTTALTLALSAAPTIDQVTVFSDRAEVSRLAETKCDGDGVRFEGLPTTVDARTLRAEARGGRVEGVTSRTVTIEGGANERRAALERELDELNAQLRVLQDGLQGEGRARSDLSGFAGYFRQILQEELRNPKPRTRRWKQTLEFFTKRDLTARQARVKLTFEIRDLRRRIEQVAKQIATLGQSSSRDALEVTVAVACQRGRAISTRLFYVVPGATWRPEYDLRFFPKRQDGTGPGRVVLTVSALVQQSTGEDWTDAKLVLSTAKPKLGAEAPYPAALYVQVREADDAKVMVQATERRERLQAGGGDTAAGPTGAELDDGGKSFALTLPHRTTVHADGRPYWVPVDEVRGTGTARRVAVPKVSPYVYRALELKNPAAYPLLAGTLHSYRGRALAGDVALEYTAPGARMEVSLGLDEGYRVERSVLTERNEKPTLLSGRQRFARAYRVRVYNQTGTAGAVQVRENIPVSKDEAIEVELDRDETTTGVMVDDLRGFVSFDVKVERRSDEAVKLAYTISLPDDWKVR